jgi:hypothetical protein
MQVIWVKCEPEYFCKWDSTGKSVFSVFRLGEALAFPTFVIPGHAQRELRASGNDV